MFSGGVTLRDRGGRFRGGKKVPGRSYSWRGR